MLLIFLDGAIWGVLGAIQGVLGAIQGVPGVSQSVPGEIWGVLDAPQGCLPLEKGDLAPGQSRAVRQRTGRTAPNTCWSQSISQAGRCSWHFGSGKTRNNWE